MASFLVAWECGAAMGYVAQLRPLVEELANRGHHVSIAGRDVALCHRILGQPGVDVYQSPVMPKPFSGVRLPCTYSDVLFTAGFSEPDLIEGTTIAWRNLFHLLRPDLILADNSPTALIAARGWPAATVIIGTGYCIPPDMTPLPSFRPNHPAPSWQLDVENTVLNNINTVLEKFDAPPLDRVAQLFADVDRQYLLTFPELDHYPSRNGAKYWHPMGSILGESPKWPRDKGPSVFISLRGHPALIRLLKALQQTDWQAICYSEGAPCELQDSLEGTNVRIVDRPLDMKAICQQSDAAILNGGHGITCDFLLAGKPVLIHPHTLEQEITGANIARIGAGLVGKVDAVDDAILATRRLLTEPNFAAAASRFSKKYQDRGVQQRVCDLVSDIESLARKRVGAAVAR
jgi:UDP:flavonoid glycosyltransferase YjiC (YdhE family)